MTKPQASKREIKWALQRMQHVLNWWRKLDSADRQFLLDKFCSDYSQDVAQVLERRKLYAKP